MVSTVRVSKDNLLYSEDNAFRIAFGLKAMLSGAFMVEHREFSLLDGAVFHEAKFEEGQKAQKFIEQNAGIFRGAKMHLVR